MGSRSSAWSGGPLTVQPIGLVRTPFQERREAPRQASLAKDVEGRVELFAGRGLEDAVSDLAGWSYVWLITWFDRNEHGFRPKVSPPRSDKKRGVLSTRAPYRPNPIGLSAVRLLSVEGLTLRIQGVDLLDRTPLLDLKPYVTYSDAIPDATNGWLDSLADPEPRYTVSFSDHARAQLAFLAAHGAELEKELVAALELGPSPHAYRRIRKDGAGYRIALKEWRAFFRTQERHIEVERLESGYRPAELQREEGGAPRLHRDFAARFGR